MSTLSPAEKFELGAIPVVTLFSGWLVPATGLQRDLGEFVAATALLILLQGLVRDLWLLRQARRTTFASPNRVTRCMCVESAMGLTGVIAGIGLVGFGLARTVHLSATSVTFGVAATMIAGFLLKDLVFEWSPWKIYREKDHASVIFRWGK